MSSNQFSELAMDNMNLSQLNDEELVETQGGIIWFVAGLVAGFIINVAYDMGKNDGAKNKDQ